MTIFNTAYDTHACKGFNIAQTQHDIRVGIVKGWLPHLHADIVSVEDGTSSVDTIPAFSHPIALYDKDKNDEFKVAIDSRPYGKWDRVNSIFRKTNVPEWELLALRARLNYHWLQESIVDKQKPTHIRDISPLCMDVYANWISTAAQRKFSLEPNQQYQLMILSAVFYYTLFTNETSFDDEEKRRCSAIISRSLKVEQGDVLNVLDQMETNMTGVADFCRVAGEITGSLRLKELTPAVLFAMVSGSWFGYAAREIIHAAIEHPPTWVAVLYRASEERGYHGTEIGKLVNRSTNSKITADFKRALITLVNTEVPLNPPSSGL